MWLRACARLCVSVSMSACASVCVRALSCSCARAGTAAGTGTHVQVFYLFLRDGTKQRNVVATYLRQLGAELGCPGVRHLQSTHQTATCDGKTEAAKEKRSR